MGPQIPKKCTAGSRELLVRIQGVQKGGSMRFQKYGIKKNFQKGKAPPSVASWKYDIIIPEF